jgi:Transposase IS116/IS110/IS902 family
MDQLDHEITDLLSQHQDAVRRLAEVPVLGVDSAREIIAEVGAAAATFPSERHLPSWIGVCLGEEERAGALDFSEQPISEGQPLHAAPVGAHTSIRYGCAPHGVAVQCVALSFL